MMYTGHNLNDMARVKPTRRGLAMIEDRRAALVAFAPSLDWSAQWTLDKDGYLCLQLWEVANIFGSAMFNGADPPIETHFLLEETERCNRSESAIRK